MLYCALSWTVFRSEAPQLGCSAPPIELGLACLRAVVPCCRSSVQLSLSHETQTQHPQLYTTSHSSKDLSKHRSDFSSLICSIFSPQFPVQAYASWPSRLAKTLGKQNVMDSVLARPPSTPTRAKSAGPCRPHRDPMEDADSSSTRKRPRLDSGDRAYRSMSVDRFNTTPSDAELPDAPEAPSDSQHPSAPSETTNALPPMSLTPSKVTINVREPPGNSSPPRPPSKANGASILRGGSGGDEPLSSQQDASGMLNSPSSNVISVHSSPRHSPEIEVAEVEDMNDEPAETRWKPLASAASAIEAKETQRALLDNFPYLGERGRSLRKTVTALALALEKSTGATFPFEERWLILYRRP